MRKNLGLLQYKKGEEITLLKIGAVFVPVLDVEKAIVWYREKLELEHVGTWSGNTGADFYFSDEKQYLSLVKVEEKQETEFAINAKHNNAYYNFTTTNIEAYHQQLHEKGLHVTEIKDHGAIISFEFYDLDGNLFSVVVDK